MRKVFNKGICISLATILAISAAGCGKKSNDSLIENATKSSKEYVFATEVLDIADNVQNINRVSCVGDRVYASTYSSGDHIDVYSFYSDGSDVQNIKLPSKDNDSISYLSFDGEGNIYGINFKYAWSNEEIEDPDEEGHSEESDDGEMHIFTEEEAGSEEASSEEVSSEEESSEEIASEDASDEISEIETDYYSSGEDETYLVIYDKEGNLQEKIDLMADFGEDGYVAINSFTVTDDGTALLSLDQGIISYTKENGFKKLVDQSQVNDYIYYQLYRGFNGQIFVSYYDDNGNNLCSFDPKTGTIGSKSQAISAYGDRTFFGGSGYDLYMSDSEGFWGYDAASDSMTKLMDYVDSDIEADGSVSAVVAISDAEFVACLPDADYNFYLARLTKVAPEDVKDKKILTLGGYYLDYEIRKQAFAFNKNNSEYKIKFVDYSSYDTDDNYGAGAEKLNMDIVSGNTPDILVISDDLPVDSYINKGLFTDLTNYLANDPDVSESDLLTNVVDAFKTGDKLYQLVPSFYFATMVMKTKLTDGKDILTFKDCEDLMDKMGATKQTAFGLETRNEFLEQGIRYSGNTYIDWENKTCHFDSESFIHFLEFSKDFVEEFPDNVWEDYKDTLYRTDDALFSIMSFSEFRDYQYWKQGMFGTDISFVGYPNDMGINNSIIYPSKRLAISSQSKYKDAAWEYIKAFLSEEYQDDTYCFPIRKSSFDKKADEITHNPYYEEDGVKVEYEDSYYIGGQDIPMKPLTKDEVLEITNFIKSLTLVSNYNSSVNNIIFEEASAYYSGQKSAKEVADIIQSRLSIYVNENS
ncbi:ABC transporter substrate-binding protein [Butyrivibrio sp. VCB2006]|uniref:ABC transporter substrate-binding protein n=1 Tax=Butyrivibrio sp. VCB2006 TaxID=1280679 RepID=UPI000412C2FC|nr:extracellular solute-binding protein [Butyrivibrio sp. VCB2006]